MRDKVAFIILNVALLLLITSIGGTFVFKGDFFDMYYAVGSCAGVSMLLISFSIYQNNWGVIPIAIVFGLFSIYFLIDFSVLDDLVKTKKAGVFILITSFLCYVYLFIQQLWHR
jgi:hypothetical protein